MSDTHLDIRTCGHVDAAVYDGLPHYLAVTLGDLLKLLIVSIERMEADDVAMYRRLLTSTRRVTLGRRNVWR